jgi:hypothetical protein
VLLYGNSSVDLRHHLADAGMLEYGFNQQSEQESFEGLYMFQLKCHV